MKKKIFSSLLIIVLIVFLMTVSASALSFTATMTPSKTTVTEKEEFTVTVKVSNLDVGQNGINSLQGYLKYDSDVFEPINESNIEKLNGWTPTYDEATGKISLTKNTFASSSQEVFQIAFKAKAGVSGKSGSISFTNISASNSESNISATDISTSITVGTSSDTDDNTTSNTTNSTNTIVIQSVNTTRNTPSNNNTTNTTNNTNVAITTNTSNTANNSAVTSYVNTVTNTNSNEDMPYTGVSDTVVKLMFIAIAVAFVFYIKIEKLNNDMK